MKIQETTRRLIIDELLMYGCVSGQMKVSEFVQRVFPKAMHMPTTDHRFGMTTAIEDIHQHMDYNYDWEFEYTIDALKMRISVFGGMVNLTVDN